MAAGSPKKQVSAFYPENVEARAMSDFLFEKLDADKSGYLDSKEMKRAKDLMLSVSLGGSTSMRTSGDSVHDSLSALMDDLDRDHDGRVDGQEWDRFSQSLYEVLGQRQFLRISQNWACTLSNSQAAPASPAAPSGWMKADGTAASTNEVSDSTSTKFWQEHLHQRQDEISSHAVSPSEGVPQRERHHRAGVCLGAQGAGGSVSKVSTPSSSSSKPLHTAGAGVVASSASNAITLPSVGKPPSTSVPPNAANSHHHSGDHHHHGDHNHHHSDDHHHHSDDHHHHHHHHHHHSELPKTIDHHHHQRKPIPAPKKPGELDMVLCANQAPTTSDRPTSAAPPAKPREDPAERKPAVPPRPAAPPKEDPAERKRRNSEAPKPTQKFDSGEVPQQRGSVLSEGAFFMTATATTPAIVMRRTTEAFHDVPDLDGPEEQPCMEKTKSSTLRLNAPWKGGTQAGFRRSTSQDIANDEDGNPRGRDMVCKAPTPRQPSKPRASSRGPVSPTGTARPPSAGPSTGPRKGRRPSQDKQRQKNETQDKGLTTVDELFEALCGCDGRISTSLDCADVAGMFARAFQTGLETEIADYLPQSFGELRGEDIKAGQVLGLCQLLVADPTKEIELDEDAYREHIQFPDDFPADQCIARESGKHGVLSIRLFKRLFKIISLLMCIDEVYVVTHVMWVCFSKFELTDMFAAALIQDCASKCCRGEVKTAAPNLSPKGEPGALERVVSASVMSGDGESDSDMSSLASHDGEVGHANLNLLKLRFTASDWSRMSHNCGIVDQYHRIGLPSGIIAHIFGSITSHIGDLVVAREEQRRNFKAGVRQEPKKKEESKDNFDSKRRHDYIKGRVQMSILMEALYQGMPTTTECWQALGAECYQQRSPLQLCMTMLKRVRNKPPAC